VPPVSYATAPGQHPTTLNCCITQKKQTVSPLLDGPPAPTWTWLSRVSARQPTAGQTCSRKVPAVTTSALPHNSTKLKEPAHSDPVKRWNFRKDDWKRFCLLTGESVERLPPPDTSNIEKSFQDFCESLLSAAEQCIPRGRRKNYVPC